MLAALLPCLPLRTRALCSRTPVRCGLISAAQAQWRWQGLAPPPWMRRTPRLPRVGRRGVQPAHGLRRPRGIASQLRSLATALRKSSSRYR